MLISDPYRFEEEVTAPHTPAGPDRDATLRRPPERAMSDEEVGARLTAGLEHE